MTNGTVAGSTSPWKQPAGSFLRVEDIDRAIVAALTADGRLSYTDLAERVGLSV